MTLRTVIEAWRESMVEQDGISSEIAEQRFGDVIRFVTWMAGQGRGQEVEQFRPADAHDYRVYLVTQGKSAATIHRALHSMWLFMEAQGRQGAQNPFHKVAR